MLLFFTSESLLSLRWSFSSLAHLWTGPLRSRCWMQFWLNMSSRRLLDSQNAGPGRAAILLVLISTDLKLGVERAENQHRNRFIYADVGLSAAGRARTSHLTHFGRQRMALETSVKLLFASFRVVILEGRSDKEPGENTLKCT